MSRIRLASSVAAVLAVVATASPAPALVVVRNLNVGNTGLGLIAADAVDVAAGPDDILQFVFDSPNYANDPSDDAVPYRTLVQRRLTTAGVWHGEGRVDTTGDFDGGSTVVPLADGFGFLWSLNAKQGYVAYRRLHNAGDPPYGPVRYLSQDPTGSAPAAAAIGDRVMAVWNDTFGAGVVGRVITANGSIVSAVVVDPGMAALGAVAAVPGAGFVVSWFDYGTRETKVRPFTAEGFATAPATVLLGNAANARIAVGGDGIGAVLAGRQTTPDDSTILLQRFDATTGAPIGGEIEVVTGDLHLLTGDLGFDPSGNMFVVWGRNDNSAPLGVRARAFAADGSPLGPIVTLSNSIPDGRVRTSRIPDGTFVTAWVNTFGFPTGNVVSLCDPGSAVCGDGVFVPTCERCDDGAANSDTTPDACRTDCTRPRCGDGVVDGGESCDDGNTVSCDGCSADCAVEVGLTCGDGVIAPHGCGETCDDGNGVAGDGCSATCALERIPGGGSTQTDCYAEWRVDNPTNLPLLDTHGHFSAQQACVDDDPQCDFDGGVPGSCTFHVSVCANNVDDPVCETPSRLATWTLDRPSAGQAAKKPLLAAVRAALESAVPGSIVGPTTTDLCSPTADVLVPLRGAPGAWRPQILKLKTHAALYDGSRDNDGLKLVCLPSP